MAWSGTFNQIINVNTVVLPNDVTSWRKISLILSKDALIDQKYSKNSNIVEYYYNLK